MACSVTCDRLRCWSSGTCCSGITAPSLVLPVELGDLLRPDHLRKVGRLRLPDLLLLPARRRSAAVGIQSRTRIERWSPPASDDSHRDPRRWLRRGLHCPPPGEAL